VKCEEIVYEIVPFYSGDLDELKEKEYKRHMLICKNCARFSFRIRKALTFLRENKPQIKYTELGSDIKL
jgi:hypothetical protein